LGTKWLPFELHFKDLLYFTGETLRSLECTPQHRDARFPIPNDSVLGTVANTAAHLIYKYHRLRPCARRRWLRDRSRSRLQAGRKRISSSSKTFSTSIALTAAFLVMGAPALGQSVPELDNADLMTRPGLLHYGATVGNLLECLTHAPILVKVLSTTKTGEGQYVVRVENARGSWMDLYFRMPTYDAALLVAGRVADGSYGEGLGAIRVFVEAISKSCGASASAFI
jgi:hypothetical protein